MSEPHDKPDLGTEPHPHHLARPRRFPWLNVLLALLILVSGMVIGGVSTGHFILGRIKTGIQQPELVPHHVVSRMRWRLGLDDAQAEEVERILHESQSRLTAIRDGVYPDVVHELDDARERVIAVLTPEQAEKWSNIFDRLRANFLPPPAAE